MVIDCAIYVIVFYNEFPGGSRNNIGYRVVQQQPLGLNDEDDENLGIAESSDDERAGYPTLPADGMDSRPSVNSLRHVSNTHIKHFAPDAETILIDVSIRRCRS